jgi:hypothetical protein
MSRAECKTTYAEQQAATEDADTALSVKECVRNPTPRCEAQFKPILEAFAASQEAGS